MHVVTLMYRYLRRFHAYSCYSFWWPVGCGSAALDFARERDWSITGWVPNGGYAEDYPKPPGVLEDYPELQETETSKLAERTELNVSDSDASLIFLPDDEGLHQGTHYTVECAEKHCKPYLIVQDLSDEGAAAVREWLQDLEGNVDLNVAGPRESGAPGIYDKVVDFLGRVFAPESDLIIKGVPIIERWASDDLNEIATITKPGKPNPEIMKMLEEERKRNEQRGDQ